MWTEQRIRCTRGAMCMLNKTEVAISDAKQVDNKLWWEKNPMAYDWQGTILAQQGTREFFEEIDRRFFGSSPFYLGQKPSNG